mgnify:CR=1 FL=1
MKILTIAATALLLSASMASAQTPAEQGQPATDTPVLAGATPAPDCGNLYELNGKAFCVSALLTGVGALAETYISDFESKGWLVAAGDNNRVVFVKRRTSGGCDGLQMQAFYDTATATTPTTLGYLGFATIPGDLCAARPAPTAPAGPPAQ